MTRVRLIDKVIKAARWLINERKVASAELAQAETSEAKRLAYEASNLRCSDYMSEHRMSYAQWSAAVQISAEFEK